MSFGKCFWKTNKNNWRSGKKQIKAIQDQEPVKKIKKHAYDAEDTPFTSKQKEIFNELVDERRKKITDLDERVNSDDLIHRYKVNIADVKFDNALGIINKIRDGKTDVSDVKNNQEKFKSYLRESKKGNKKHKLKEQKNTLYNIEILYKARNEAVKFYDEYSLMMSIFSTNIWWMIYRNLSKLSFIWNFWDKKVTSIQSNIFWNFKVWLGNKKKNI